jgi:hypothetical protein
MSIGDLVFHGAELLRTTRLTEFSLSMADWPLALWLQSHFYAIPTFQTLHILAIAVLFSSSLMLNLRVLGVNGKDLNLEAALRRFRPWFWWALVALVASGAFMLISEPVRNLTNPIFWGKMTLLAIGILATLWFQAAIRHRMATWDVSPAGHASLRSGAVALTILWCLVIAGGRWIAYAPI